MAMSTSAGRPAVPATMRAVRVEAPGDAASLRVVEDAPVPTLGPRQVLVRNACVGLNFIDTYHRSGLYTVQLPFTLGVEGAGEVVALGSQVSPEEIPNPSRVAYYSAGGAYAEYTACPIDNVVQVPDGVDAPTAVACLTQGMTAHYLATSTFPLGPGHTAVVHAAAGGTGQLLVQVAKIRGAHVVGTCSAAKAGLAAECGADAVVVYDGLNPKQLAEAIRAEAGGRGADVVFDGVGKSTFEASLDCLRKRGVCVLFGNASGPVPPIDPLALTAKGSLFLTRPKLYDYLEDRAELQMRCGELFKWVQSGQLKVKVQRSFPLAQAGEAHAFIEAGKTTGKIVLDPAGADCAWRS